MIVVINGTETLLPEHWKLSTLTAVLNKRFPGKILKWVK